MSATSCPARSTPRPAGRAGEAAEQAGFEALWISDHFHPWNDEQGQSPFVWSVIGAISPGVATCRSRTAVTCPTVRIHPAIIAQAAATAAGMLDGQFTLGVGTGEALNEHILGDRWPSADVRLEMLEEAVELIRGLWTGRAVSHHGGALPRRQRAHLHAARRARRRSTSRASGPRRRELAARIGDGYITTPPDAELVGRFKEARRRQAGAGRGRRSAWAADRGRGRRARAPAVGRTAACPASSPRCCRRRRTSSRPRSW